MTPPRQPRLEDPSTPVQPRFVELIRLDRRLSARSLSHEPADALLLIRALRYVAELNAELDRVRPRRHAEARLPWDGDWD